MKPSPCQHSRLVRLLLSAVIMALAMCRPASICAGQLRIVTAEEPPANFSINGEASGIVTDVVREILERLHQNATIEVLPWARAYHLALNASDVVIFTAGRTSERVDHGFHFVGPVTTRRHTLYADAGRIPDIAGIDDIRRLGLRVVAMRGDWRGAFFRDRGVDVEETANHLLAVQMLLHGRVHLFVSSDLELGELLRIAGVKRTLIKPAFVFQEREAFIMLSKDILPNIVAQWQEAFAALRETAFFERTARKWSDYLGVPLLYSPDKGFYLK